MYDVVANIDDYLHNCKILRRKMRLFSANYAENSGCNLRILCGECRACALFSDDGKEGMGDMKWGQGRYNMRVQKMCYKVFMNV